MYAPNEHDVEVAIKVLELDQPEANHLRKFYADVRESARLMRIVDITLSIAAAALFIAFLVYVVTWTRLIVNVRTWRP